MVLLIWYYSDRSREKEAGQFRQAIRVEREAQRQQWEELKRKYEKDLDEVRNMYESNVTLVNGYHSIAKDFKDVVLLNTGAITRLDEGMRSNLWCPVSREKTNPKEVGR